jgi:hypothetical protein
MSRLDKALNGLHEQLVEIVREAVSEAHEKTRLPIDIVDSFKDRSHGLINQIGNDLLGRESEWRIKVSEAINAIESTLL